MNPSRRKLNLNGTELLYMCFNCFLSHLLPHLVMYTQEVWNNLENQLYPFLLAFSLT